MERIEFYKMSVSEYPNHKDRQSLAICINELQNEVDELYRYINYLEDNDGGNNEINQFIKDHDSLYKVVQLARTYLNNPTNCKGCINWTVSSFGERCSYLKTDVNSPNDNYKHHECPVT